MGIGSKNLKQINLILSKQQLNIFIYAYKVPYSLALMQIQYMVGTNTHRQNLVSLMLLLMNIHLVAAKCLHLIMEISITEQTAQDSLIPVRVKLQRLAYECQLSQINSADTCASVF